MCRRSMFVLFALAWTATAFAQVTVGRLYSSGESTTPTALPPYSVIEIMHPAGGSGNLTHAVVRWSGGPTITPCQNAFKLRFVRPAGFPGNYAVFAERGPFPGVNGSNEIALTPAIGVLPGDMIAITQLVSPTSCGGFVETRAAEVTSLALGSEDLAGLNAVPGLSPAIFASTGAASVVAVLAAAGATAGSNGSFFRTSVQLTNNDAVPLSGTLVYHPQGAAGTASDPSMPFTLNPQQTLSVADFATALGQTGLGSIDVMTSGMTPLVSARIFNDAASGTSGFTEEGLAPSQALALAQNAFLQIPADTTNFRMNVGVRTLSGDTPLLSVNTYTADGTLAGTASKIYQLNFYEQTTAQAFTGLSALPAGGTIRVRVTGGRIIVYGTTTDNRTNDSNLQFALSTQ